LVFFLTEIIGIILSNSHITRTVITEVMLSMLLYVRYREFGRF